jgi:hypothetical protein
MLFDYPFAHTLKTFMYAKRNEVPLNNPYGYDTISYHLLYINCVYFHMFLSNTYLLLLHIYDLYVNANFFWRYLSHHMAPVSVVP